MTIHVDSDSRASHAVLLERLNIVRTSRGRPRTVFKENPTTTGRATCADSVEQPDTRGRSGRSVNRDTLGEEPLIEGGAMDPDETTYTDDGEVRLAGEVAEFALGDRAIRGQQAERQVLGPLGA